MAEHCIGETRERRFTGVDTGRQRSGAEDAIRVIRVSRFVHHTLVDLLLHLLHRQDPVLQEIQNSVATLRPQSVFDAAVIRRRRSVDEVMRWMTRGERAGEILGGEEMKMAVDG